MADGRSLIFKNGTSFAFLVAFCVLNFVHRVNCITVLDKSESKTKREGVDGTLIGTYTKKEVKPFYPSKASSSNFGEIQQKDKGIKNRLTIYNTKDRDNTPAGSGYEDRDKQYGLYAPEEQAYQGYGYQDFDQTSHYGPPQPSGFSGERGGYPHIDTDYKDHREEYPGFGVPHYRPDPHAIALKGILIPLAGVALLGAAAALVTNPILLQLGVISGGKRRRRSLRDDERNHDPNSKEIYDQEYNGPSIGDILKNAKVYYAESAEEKKDFEKRIIKDDNAKKVHKVEELLKLIANDKHDKNNENDELIVIRHEQNGSDSTKNADTIENNGSGIILGIDRGKNKAEVAGVSSSNVQDNTNSDYDDVHHENVRFVDTLQN